DAQERCPNEPEDRDGFEDDDGCPDLDNDGDGIADAQDSCPNEPETFNGVDDSDGCPDSGGAVRIAGDKIELPDNIWFDTGRATIARRSEALVGRVADKLNANPRVRRIRIEGHTDDIGSARKNQELSQARAEAVRDFLIRRGVDADRLQAVGFGNTRPLDSHRNAEARAKNRRVDFIIVEQ
ncbi:MAG TPA: OmpA family protein, partial [Polyangia bacterium]